MTRRELLAEPQAHLQSGPLLRVRDLKAQFQGSHEPVQAVRGVSFDISAGQTVGLVGESGSGKSATAMSILGLLPEGKGEVVGGSVEFEGRDLVTCGSRELRAVRGRRVGVVFQDASTALNPVMTVGAHLREALRSHARPPRSEATRRGAELLGELGIAQPKRILGAYPHELSGGMKQRVMIAVALINEPSLIIADEPTTALDVTIQAQILDLLANMARRMGIATLLITHDMGVIARYTDRTLVMYAGKVVEEANTPELFRRPQHPYTHALLNSVPRLRMRDRKLEAIPGVLPSLSPPPAGCAFAPRCRFAEAGCWTETPAREAIAEDHLISCGVKPELV